MVPNNGRPPPQVRSNGPEQILVGLLVLVGRGLPLHGTLLTPLDRARCFIAVHMFVL